MLIPSSLDTSSRPFQIPKKLEHREGYERLTMDIRMVVASCLDIKISRVNEDGYQNLHFTQIQELKNILVRKLEDKKLKLLFTPSIKNESLSLEENKVKVDIYVKELLDLSKELKSEKLIDILDKSELYLPFFFLHFEREIEKNNSQETKGKLIKGPHSIYAKQYAKIFDKLLAMERFDDVIRLSLKINKPEIQGHIFNQVLKLLRENENYEKFTQLFLELGPDSFYENKIKFLKERVGILIQKDRINEAIQIMHMIVTLHFNYSKKMDLYKGIKNEAIKACTIQLIRMGYIKELLEFASLNLVDNETKQIVAQGFIKHYYIPEGFSLLDLIFKNYYRNKTSDQIRKQELEYKKDILVKICLSIIEDALTKNRLDYKHILLNLIAHISENEAKKSVLCNVLSRLEENGTFKSTPGYNFSHIESIVNKNFEELKQFFNGKADHFNKVLTLQYFLLQFLKDEIIPFIESLPTELQVYANRVVHS